MSARGFKARIDTFACVLHYLCTMDSQLTFGVILADFFMVSMAAMPLSPLTFKSIGDSEARAIMCGRQALQPTELLTLGLIKFSTCPCK